MRLARLWPLVALLAGACRPSENECARLLDHFLDVEARDAQRGFAGLSERMAQGLADEKRALREAIGGEFVQKCRAQLGRADVRCAIEAGDPDAMDRCDGR